MTASSEAIVASLLSSFDNAKMSDTPYRHWFLENCLTGEALAACKALPFDAPALGGVSGKRELHNKTRSYFDADNRAAHGVCDDVARAFQDQRVTGRIADFFGTDIDGSYLRIEYAKDTDGFWLEPHTDLGVKLFTMLLYVSDGPGHEDLGTDIYDTDKNHVGRSPFKANGAMIFVPSDITYHGFEARPIDGVRQSIIINFVTNEWRAREQLAFPDEPIRLGA